MAIDFDKCTFGAEYEYGDCLRGLTLLPDGLSWNTKDYSIVSSTGIANDPKGELYVRGGEVNTAPTNSIPGQIELFEKYIKACPESALNHRTNLHIHIGIPGFMEDLGAMKQFLRYVDKNQDAVYAHIEPIPKPTTELYPDPAALKGAMKRYNRRKISHQKRLPEARVAEALASDTPQHFIEALATPKKDGGRAWAISTRAGINMMQLRETGTIEFRHFTNTLDSVKLHDCFDFVLEFSRAALEDSPIESLLSDYDASNFPPFVPYDHYMEIGYQWTNFDKNSRRIVRERLKKLDAWLEERNYPDSSSCDCDALTTSQAIAEIDPEFYAQFA